MSEKTWKFSTFSGICSFLAHQYFACIIPLSELERHLLVPYSTKANAFCELGRKKIGKNEPCSPQKAFAFVEYGTRRCLSSSDRGVACPKMVSFILSYHKIQHQENHDLTALKWIEYKISYLSIAFIKCNCNVFSSNIVWKPLKIVFSMTNNVLLININKVSALFPSLNVLKNSSVIILLISCTQ